jgi:hypothetical protein
MYTSFARCVCQMRDVVREIAADAYSSACECVSLDGASRFQHHQFAPQRGHWESPSSSNLRDVQSFICNLSQPARAKSASKTAASLSFTSQMAGPKFSHPLSLTLECEHVAWEFAENLAHTFNSKMKKLTHLLSTYACFLMKPFSAFLSALLQKLQANVFKFREIIMFSCLAYINKRTFCV